MFQLNYTALNKMSLIDLINAPSWALFPFLATKPAAMRKAIIKHWLRGAQ